MPVPVHVFRAGCGATRVRAHVAVALPKELVLCTKYCAPVFPLTVSTLTIMVLALAHHRARLHLTGAPLVLASQAPGKIRFAEAGRLALSPSSTSPTAINVRLHASEWD